MAHLGLARRAGALDVGVAAARQAVRDGRARLVVLAADAAAGQRAKVEAVAEARGVPVRIVASSEVLGAAVGHGPVTALAVTDAGLARAAQAALARAGQ
jgi:ribosomal protein L7Ae-like RNA K-turn-binding protein